MSRALLFACSLVLSILVAASDLIVFGPQVYTRGSGKPVAVKKTFRIARPPGPYTMRVVNHGVTSAEIALNGRVVFSPDDFVVRRGRDRDDDRGRKDDDDRGSREGGRDDRDRREDDRRKDDDRHDGETAVASLTQKVSLRDGTNEVVVELRSQPGTSLVLDIFTPGAPTDTTPPTIVATPTPAPNANGWNNSAVTVSFTCADNSGSVTCPPPVVVTSEGMNQAVTGTARDAAGNTATATVRLNIDRTPPIVTAAAAPAANADGWNADPVVVTFSATDALSGIAPGSLTAPLTLAGDGANQSAAGQAQDLAGNVGTVTRAGINVDRTKPIISATLSTPPNADGWNNGPVTIHFVCADSASGISVCPPDRTFTTDGASQSVSGTARDRAGNEATATATVSIDSTPPAFTWVSPPSGATLLASPITAIGAASDDLSGIASATCNGARTTVVNGRFNCGAALVQGQNSVNASVTDAAGNVRTATLPLTYARSPVVAILTPANGSYLNVTPTTVTGTVDTAAATVTVNSVPAPVVNGSFSIPLPLAEGPNVITASAAVAGAIGTGSVSVTLDTTQPHVTITSPPDKFVTTDDSISVAGIVNDIVVGTVNDQQAQVTVNGTPAQVANRTFLASGIPLSIGPNVVQAVGRDRVGNAATTEITVTRQAPSARGQVKLISGNNQMATIGMDVAEPLVVALTDGAGHPVPNKPVIFKVKQNDGLLTSNGPPAPTVIAATDAQGQAHVLWTLGHRSGAGGNNAEAYAVGFDNTVLFAATGLPGAPALIVVDAGNDQTGAIGQRLAKPFIAVVVDEGHNRLDGVPVMFSVVDGGSFAGESSVIVTTDSDGRASAALTLGLQEGNANNVVEAEFASDHGAPARFTASARVPGDPASTTVSGVVLDNSNRPVPGVTIRAVLTNALRSNLGSVQSAAAIQTNAQGQFVVPQAPVGLVKLLVDGTTAQLPGSWPSLEYDMVTVSGRDNTVGQPIYLLPLSTANQLCVTPTTGGGTLTMPEAPGFSLTFGPGQVTFPGGSKSGCVSVTVVHNDKVPMLPAFGQQPSFIVTIQPPGAMFNPPAPMTLPNVYGLRPREVTEMYSYDHDIESFVAIGTGAVSDDGQLIRSSPGVGVLKAGWHSGGPPNPGGTVSNLRVTINPRPLLTVDKGSSAPVIASGSPGGGNYSWTIDDASIGSLRFGASPNAVAIAGLKVGTATLTVTYRSGNRSATASITVKVREVAKVRIVTSRPLNVKTGETGTVTAVGTPTPGTYSWSTSDATIATIQDPASGSSVTSVTVNGVANGLAVIIVRYTSNDGSVATASIPVKVSPIGARPIPIPVLGETPIIDYTLPAGIAFDSVRMEIVNARGDLVFKRTGLPTSAGQQTTTWDGVKWSEGPNAGKFANPNNGPYDINIILVKGGVESVVTRSTPIRLVVLADVADPEYPGASRAAGLSHIRDTLKIVMKRGSVETVVPGTDEVKVVIETAELHGAIAAAALTINADDFNTLDDGVYTVIFRDVRDDIGNVADSDSNQAGAQPYQFTIELR